MTDRELLEAAAKAAGIAPYRYGDAVFPRPHVWNPLADDGDALRLAVRLRITPHIDGSMTEAEAATQDEGGFFAEPHIDDPYAATRRAIVRAAAAMARAYGVSKPPLVEWAEHLDDLYWHALNYRTAAPQHAEAMWQELLACVERKVAAERERCALVCERQAQTPHNAACPRAVDGWWPDQVTYACAEAIRATPPTPSE